MKGTLVFLIQKKVAADTFSTTIEQCNIGNYNIFEYLKQETQSSFKCKISLNYYNNVNG